ncbi:hypothetical protein BpHYR1_049677, partial [Brachionus plicatilis]
TLFTKEDDELLLELFRTRVQNNWSEAELERQFKQSSGRKITFKTLKARLNVLNPVQSSITIVRTGTSASFLNSEICLTLDQPMSLSHEQPIIDQHMTSLTHEADIANLTSELDQSLSIIEDASDAGSSFQLNVEGNDSVTPKSRRRGRPVGSKNKKKTPASIKWEVGQSRVKRIRTNDPVFTPNPTRRNLTDQLLQLHNDTIQQLKIPVETDAEIMRIRRAFETPEQTLERQVLDSQRHRVLIENETPEQTLERQTLDSQFHRERRANETSAELDVRLNSDSASHRNRKGNETPAQKADRLKKAAEKQKD